MSLKAASPYADLANRAFWKTAVADRNMFDIADLWEPKVHLGPKMPVVTYGSCFAQHIGATLRARNFNWLNLEKTPGNTPQADAAFNYGVFSARTGSIYTATLLLQWVRWATGQGTAPDEVWHHDGRVQDPFRPQIEPHGFTRTEEVLRSRKVAINAFGDSIRKAQVFVFTLGLTERWHNTDAGHEYPLCPGTAAGKFDPDCHRFENLGFAKTHQALHTATQLMRQMNPNLRFIFTVSPVPLTATKSGNHVIPATTYSKSVLRAVCGEMAETIPYVDYFPAYEIISSPAFRGSFYAPNQRDVAAKGVAHVMQHFFDAQAARPSRPKAAPPPDPAALVCEEALLARAKGLH